MLLTTTAWTRDLPDFRDDSPATVADAFVPLKRRATRAVRPEAVDLREFAAPIIDSGPAQASSAAAVLAMVQIFERRASGRFVDGSTAFLHHTARRLAGAVGEQPVGLRAVLKALVRFGCPPARVWPSDATRGDREPDAFSYGFQREFADLRYLRLDTPGLSGADVLKQVKSFVAAGFACVGGVSLPQSLSQSTTNSAEIPYPTRQDSVAGSAAFTVVGYDDAYRIRSQKGALRIRATFGPSWGEAGFGYLPYRFVEQFGACDFWTLVKPAWMQSREFEQPR
jgi:C1A family cysteine protease